MKADFYFFKKIFYEVWFLINVMFNKKNSWAFMSHEGRGDWLRLLLTTTYETGFITFVFWVKIMN